MGSGSWQQDLGSVPCATQHCTFRRKHREYLVLLGAFLVVMGKPQRCGIKYNCYMLLWLDVYGKCKHCVVTAKS